MSIDFHNTENRYTYASRKADQSWLDTFADLAAPRSKIVLDIGCGGGIYTRAWAQLGTKQVIGIDFSEKMIQTAAEQSTTQENIVYIVGNAISTYQESASADVVFERALIHHIEDLPACFDEVHRLLRPKGLYLIQDRTLEDVHLPGSPEQIRGYFFELFPKLLKFERNRRPNIEKVNTQLTQSGFTNISTRSLWEIRERHKNFAGLADDLRSRTGRSILHELTNAELEQLIEHLQKHLPPDQEIEEKDRWTIWLAEKEIKNP